MPQLSRQRSAPSPRNVEMQVNRLPSGLWLNWLALLWHRDMGLSLMPTLQSCAGDMGLEDQITPCPPLPAIADLSPRWICVKPDCGCPSHLPLSFQPTFKRLPQNQKSFSKHSPPSFLRMSIALLQVQPSEDEVRHQDLAPEHLFPGGCCTVHPGRERIWAEAWFHFCGIASPFSRRFHGFGRLEGYVSKVCHTKPG